MKKLIALVLLMTQPIICSQSVVEQLKAQLPAVINTLNKTVKYKISSTTQDIEKMAVDLVKEFPHLSVDDALNILKMTILWIDKNVGQYNKEVIQRIDASFQRLTAAIVIAISIPVAVMIINYLYTWYKNKQTNKQQKEIPVSSIKHQLIAQEETT